MANRPTTPASIAVVVSVCGNGDPSGARAPSMVPPSRSSNIAPTVMNTERPVPSSQKIRGRASAR